MSRPRESVRSNHRGSWRSPRWAPFSASREARLPGGHHPPRPEDRALATLRDAWGGVPSADGFGRNLRSKTRWFTGFCNSHQVSHFATFFIDARAEISVAESRFGCTFLNGKRRDLGDRRRSRPPPSAPRFHFCSLAPGAPGLVAGRPRARLRLPAV
ncbi:hypothetical protein K1719_038187 [Acacia pycnantha]|nr:hypothetical protein K1719_038187 [Acacia pycnantha]